MKSASERTGRDQNAPIIYYCILSSIMNVHTIIVRTFISQLFLEKMFLFYFLRIILQEIIIASLFIIEAILNPFSATLHV
jgi:hypothetical protein